MNLEKKWFHRLNTRDFDSSDNLLFSSVWSQHYLGFFFLSDFEKIVIFVYPIWNTPGNFPGRSKYDLCIFSRFILFGNKKCFLFE